MDNDMNVIAFFFLSFFLSFLPLSAFIDDSYRTTRFIKFVWILDTIIDVSNEWKSILLLPIYINRNVYYVWTLKEQIWRHKNKYKNMKVNYKH